MNTPETTYRQDCRHSLKNIEKEHSVVLNPDDWLFYLSDEGLRRQKEQLTYRKRLLQIIVIANLVYFFFAVFPVGYMTYPVLPTREYLAIMTALISFRVFSALAGTYSYHSNFFIHSSSESSCEFLLERPLYFLFPEALIREDIHRVKRQIAQPASASTIQDLSRKEIFLLIQKHNNRPDLVNLRKILDEALKKAASESRSEKIISKGPYEGYQEHEADFLGTMQLVNKNIFSQCFKSTSEKE
ncbi:MAG: hypothetical protein P1V18_03090 [Candidatus Gracilibacteria bacterium]|nr:hypothetical protein [Candidatus Gracilibacteria bacterium]